MPGISQKRFHSTIKGPAAEALDVLSAHSKEVLGLWTTAVRELGLTPAEFAPTAHLDFASMADALRRSNFSTFREGIEHLAERLARRGVGVGRTLAAFNRLFELCLPYVARTRSNRATIMLALARIHALIELLLISGYAGHSSAGKATLVEASLSEAEQRVHGASAYVTKIYERERRRLS